MLHDHALSLQNHPQSLPLQCISHIFLDSYPYSLLTCLEVSLTDLFNKYARANKLLKDNEDSLSGEDIREGMTAVISIKIEDPQFEGQTKQKLGKMKQEVLYLQL